MLVPFCGAAGRTRRAHAHVALRPRLRVTLRYVTLRCVTAPQNVITSPLLLRSLTVGNVAPLPPPPRQKCRPSACIVRMVRMSSAGRRTPDQSVRFERFGAGGVAFSDSSALWPPREEGVRGDRRGDPCSSKAHGGRFLLQHVNGQRQLDRHMPPTSSGPRGARRRRRVTAGTDARFMWRLERTGEERERKR